MLPRIPEWYDVLLGMFSAGVVPMPATILCTPRDVEYRVNRAEAEMIVTDAEGAAKVEEVLDRCPTVKHLIVVGDQPQSGWIRYGDLVDRASDRPPDARPTSKDDPLLIYFTSGTVAYPKMVLHTHASYGVGHEITARFWQDLTPGDLHWTVSDTGWAKAAWGKLFGQWRIGASIFLWDQRGKFDPELALRVLERSGGTTFCAPPTLFRAFVLLDLSKFDLSRVRHSVSAGEPLNPEIIKVWKEATGTTIYDGYGQTETVNIVANFPCMPVKPGSMGRPTPTFDVDVVDEEGNRLPPGQEGHIAVRVAEERPVGLFKEYWRDSDATGAAFQNGWYYTGDRAQRDEDGYLWFVGRADDVIISASYRIGPFEVESALVEHPACAESAVVGKPDPERTSIVKAYVVLAPGYEPSDELVRDLQEHVKRVTAPYKYPREIEFVTELPKTISGKIRRVELRERAKSGDQIR
jgi:acyl-coenzyme A synthetase/AMP-(fatty) acid ligase